MKTHRIARGAGVQLQVVETGNPQGRPILFIHGASQCWLQWNRQLNSSLAEEHRLVALDMRGHGISDKPHDGYNDSRIDANTVETMQKKDGKVVMAVKKKVSKDGNTWTWTSTWRGKNAEGKDVHNVVVFGKKWNSEKPVCNSIGFPAGEDGAFDRSANPEGKRQLSVL